MPKLFDVSKFKDKESSDPSSIKSKVPEKIYGFYVTFDSDPPMLAKVFETSEVTFIFDGNEPNSKLDVESENKKVSLHFRKMTEDERQAYITKFFPFDSIQGE